MAIKTLLIEYDDTHGNGMGEFTLSAPAVEIVRCRDCKHVFDGARDMPMCSKWASTDLYPIVEPDGFCAWGERSDA